MAKSNSWEVSTTSLLLSFSSAFNITTSTFTFFCLYVVSSSSSSISSSVSSLSFFSSSPFLSLFLWFRQYQPRLGVIQWSVLVCLLINISTALRFQILNKIFTALLFLFSLLMKKGKTHECKGPCSSYT